MSAVEPWESDRRQGPKVYGVGIEGRRHAEGSRPAYTSADLGWGPQAQMGDEPVSVSSNGTPSVFEDQLAEEVEKRGIDLRAECVSGAVKEELAQELDRSVNTISCGLSSVRKMVADDPNFGGPADEYHGRRERAVEELKRRGWHVKGWLTNDQKAEVAAAVGCSRNTVSNAMRALRDEARPGPDPVGVLQDAHERAEEQRAPENRHEVLGIYTPPVEVEPVIEERAPEVLDRPAEHENGRHEPAPVLEAPPVVDRSAEGPEPEEVEGRRADGKFIPGTEYLRQMSLELAAGYLNSESVDELTLRHRRELYVLAVAAIDAVAGDAA